MLEKFRPVGVKRAIQPRRLGDRAVAPADSQLGGAAMCGGGEREDGSRCRRGSVLILVAILVMSGCARDPVDAAALDNGLVITNEIGFTTAFAVEAADPGNPDGGTEIRWKTAYNISNKTGSRIVIDDIDVNFPTGIVEGSGARLALVKSRPSEVVDLYFTPEELRDARPSTTQKPPVVLEPGGRLVATFHQALQLTLDGKVFALREGQQTVTYLGPLLRLREEADGKWGCVSNKPLRVTVRTTSGNTDRTVEHPILPDGCVLNLPPVNLPPVPDQPSVTNPPR